MPDARPPSAGGRRYLFPKDVWTPSGGWWNNEPPHWERNTGIAAVAVLITAGFAFSFSAEREVCFAAMVRFWQQCAVPFLPRFCSEDPSRR